MNRSTVISLAVSTGLVMTSPLLVMASTAPTDRPVAPHTGRSNLADTATVELKKDVVSLKVPPELTFHPRSKLLSTMPAIADSELLGILAPRGEPLEGEDTWWITIYVETDVHVPMAPLPEPAAMLKRIQDGYAAASQGRSDSDAEDVQFISLLHQAQLDTARKILTWAEEVQVGQDPQHEARVFASVFGREQVVHFQSRVPIGQQDAVWTAMAAAAGNTTFVDGERYEDFQESSSKASSREPASIVSGDSGSVTRASQSVLAGLTYRSGEVTIGDDLATLTLPDGYRYLDPKDSRRVIVDAWENPPETASDVLGMVLPADKSPLDEGVWCAVITFDDTGYVDDSEASTMDYEALLSRMKAATISANPERERSGYPTLELIGWARPPSYVTAQHALIWAKELHFSDQVHHSLNYDLRILGRSGVLSLNAVASMSEVSSVRAGMQAVLNFTHFNAGKRYEDFKPGEDKVSDLGIAALILGGTAVAVKPGLLKGLLVAILALKKFVVIGLAGIWVAVRSWLARRKSASANVPDTTTALEHRDD